MHKLFLSDFQETTYFLYAIHSELEDYRIAHNINFAFKTKLTRTQNDLDFKGNERFSFPVFKWKDTKLKSNWSLIEAFRPHLPHTGGFFSTVLEGS